MSEQKNLADEAAAAFEKIGASNGPGNTPATDPPEEVNAENAFVALAQSAVAIEKHLFALVYLYKTMNPEKTGVTYVDDVFASIYDGSDPFAEVDAVLKDLKAKGVKGLPEDAPAKS